MGGSGTAVAAPASPRALTVSVWFAWLAAATVVTLRLAGGSPAERNPEGALAALALGSLVAAPALAARAAYRTSPSVLMGAGFGLAFTSILSVATLPLLIPASVLFSKGASEARRRGGGGWRAWLAAVAIPVAVAGGIGLLFAHQDPRSWSSGEGGGSVSDVIVYWESLVILALLAATVWLSRWAAGSSSTSP